jgi:arylamine N-acetyltransferase
VTDSSLFCFSRNPLFLVLLQTLCFHLETFLFRLPRGHTSFATFLSSSFFLVPQSSCLLGF